MGNKRKYGSEDEIRRKIRKLEKKLNKRSLRRIEDSSSEGEENNAVIEEEAMASVEELFNNGSPHPTSPRPESPRMVSSRPASPRQVSPSPASPLKSTRCPGSPLEQQDHQIPIEVTPEETELDEEILQLLGDAPKADTPLGPPIHKDVANRWQEILAKGMPKEIKDQIMQQYPVPRNCDLLMAPTLNPEVKAAIRDVMTKRDSSLMYQQKQLGVALSALATSLESILTNETSKQTILKPISDACRILCDLHYNETKTRRHFVITSINTELKDSLVNTVRDSKLFGDNVTEKIKTAKSIQKSGEALKNIPKPTYKNNVNNKSNNPKNRLNFKPQYRKTENKPNTDAARGRPAYRPQRPGPSGSYKPPQQSRSPPPPRRTQRQ